MMRAKVRVSGGERERMGGPKASNKVSHLSMPAGSLISEFMHKLRDSSLVIALIPGGRFPVKLHPRFKFLRFASL